MNGPEIAKNLEKVNKYNELKKTNDAARLIESADQFDKMANDFKNAKGEAFKAAKSAKDPTAVKDFRALAENMDKAMADCKATAVELRLQDGIRKARLADLSKAGKTKYGPNNVHLLNKSRAG